MEHFPAASGQLAHPELVQAMTNKISQKYKEKFYQCMIQIQQSLLVSKDHHHKSCIDLELTHWGGSKSQSKLYRNLLLLDPHKLNIL